MRVNISWNFHSNESTLTICFIVLNRSVEFVLIYRPHPVYCIYFVVYSLFSVNNLPPPPPPPKDLRSN